MKLHYVPSHADTVFFFCLAGFLLLCCLCFIAGSSRGTRFFGLISFLSVAIFGGLVLYVRH